MRRVHPRGSPAGFTNQTVMTRPNVIVATIATVIVVAASLIIFAAPAFYQWLSEQPVDVDLPNTEWFVLLVDDVQTSPTSVVIFSREELSALLRLDCGDVRMTWTWDPEGGAMSFAPTRVPESCEDSVHAQRAIDWMTGIRSWHAESKELIRLSGDNELTLILTDALP
jgi:hypothetical protein